MIIKKLELISFGKFENKVILLDDSLNIIGGDNESGKSTIMDFIYVMFYGFGDNRGKSLSLREHYKPWSGAPCEGKMTLILDDNSEITIYRKAGSVKKNDECMVYDTSLGTPLKLNPEFLLGVSSDTFKKTLHVSQLFTAIKGESSEIAQKLSNISSSGQEDTDFDKAIGIMELMRREIKPLRGSGGELAKIENEILEAEKNEELKRLRQEEITQTDKKLKDTRAMLEDAKEKYDSFSETPSDEVAKLSGRIEEKTLYCEKQKALLSDKEEELKLIESDLKDKNTSSKSLNPLSYTLLGIAFLSLLVSFFNKFSLVFTLIFAVAFFITYLKNNKLNNSRLEELKLYTDKKDALVNETNEGKTVLFDSVNELKELKEKRNLLESKLKEEQESRKNVEESYIALSKEVASLEALLNHLNSQELSQSSDVSHLSERRAELKRALSSIEAAITALTQAHNEMQRSFTPALNKKASLYFSEITDGKYKALFTDESFNLNVSLDIPRDSSHFSGGTIDQMYLSLRLALTDMLFSDTKIFMLLDQPFIQYDEKRKGNALNLLKSLSTNRQIIIFTNDKNIKPTEILT